MTTMTTGQPADTATDGRHDFDFWMGSWTVRHRRLRQILAGSTEWYEFEGTAEARPLFGGLGNVDELEADMPSGQLSGVTVRLFNPKSRQWTIYWANKTNGKLDTPMIGEFRNGRGEFYDQEEFEGRAIYVRFIWTPISHQHCRWEQAFSADGGKTWETNWVAEFTRIA